MNKRHFDQAGKRVQTIRKIDGYKVIPAGWSGTIESEQDNGLGQDLINVVWDETGDTWPVFPSDVESL